MNCAECKHQHVIGDGAKPQSVTFIACKKFEPRGAANNPRITINLTTNAGVTCTLENVGQTDAYSLLQGCWLAAGEMFQLLGLPPNNAPPRKKVL